MILFFFPNETYILIMFSSKIELILEQHCVANTQLC